jgi:ankyrin repeat protein
MVSLLLELGADVNSGEIGNIVSLTPGLTVSHALLAAAKAGYVECAEILINAGADAGTFTKWGRSALVLAASSRTPSIPMLNLLIKHDADVNLVDQHGNTVLINACRKAKDDLTAIRLLLEHGANPNTENRKQQTPWKIAARHCKRELMVLLEQYGAKPDESVLGGNCKR